MTTQVLESMVVGGAGVGMDDSRRSLGSGGEGPFIGREERSSAAVSGNTLMEAIDITTNGI